MKLSLFPPKKSLNKAFLKQRPLRSEIEQFKNNLLKLLDKIDVIEREENQKNFIMHFLRDTYYKDIYEINTKDYKDLVIHTGKTNKDPVGVIIEAKRPGNKSEMICEGKLNCKAFQELVLYYMHERVDEKNIDVKYCIVSNIYEWYIFDASIFEKYFYRNKDFVKRYEEWRRGQKVTGDTTLFYNDIAKPFIDSIDDEIQAVHFDIRNYEKILRGVDYEEDKEKSLISLYKLFSPYHLLRVPFADDSNKLDNSFYKELLHIIGLEEVKEGSKHIIRRKEKDDRNDGSLLENAITKLSILDTADRVSDSSNYGDTKDEKNFNIALELCITWINRILFLKLLEAQLVTYHNGISRYKFLKKEMLKDFDEVFSLFHHVLAVPASERDKDVQKKFEFVPYLNSTLFEVSPLEKETINISSLNDSLSLDIINTTILKNIKSSDKSLPTLEYILRFLDAYDFSSEGTEDIQESNRTLINASVLGKVFEKINGYKDGSIFTPGFITMYMCREALRPAVVQKFKDKYNWNIENFDDLKNFMADKKSAEDVREYNETINTIKICDPAVGSGHFLVSSLNEIIAIKSELGIFADEYGIRIPDYDISVELDELIITDRQGDFFEYKIYPSSSGEGFRVRGETQRLQTTLFHEKQKIIENCLFGVDINPNSVKICRLRLWIELLKNAYYRPPPDPLPATAGKLFKEGAISSELETLPNIDINIKVGNSLISRFPLDANLSKYGQRIKDTIEEYKINVRDYKNEKDRWKKNKIDRIIDLMKNDIRTTFNKNDPKLVRLMKLKGELENLETQTGLFEQTKKDQKEQAVKKKKLEAELAKIQKEVDDIKSNAIYKNAFEWRFEFPEVLDNEGEFVGFDVVIGNPPYFSISKEAELKNLNNDYVTFESSGDIYSLFYEKGWQILKQKGLLIFITSNKWFRTNYGRKLRKFFLEKSNPILLIDFGDFQVFENSILLANILKFSKEENIKNLKVSFLTKDFKDSSQLEVFIEKNKSTRSDFTDDSWIISGSKFRQIKSKVESQGLRINEWGLKIYRGVLTGFNEAFYIDEETKSKLIEEDPKCEEIIKPILRGEHITKWSPEFRDLWLIATIPAKNLDINNFPSIMKHLLSFGKERLEQAGNGKGRKKTNNGWFELQDTTAYWEQFELPKIIYPNMTKFFPFLYDEKGFYTNQKCFIITGDSLKYLTAIFNSKLFFFCFKDNFPELLGETRELSKIYFEKIPIKKVTVEEEKPYIHLVDEIIESKKQGKDTTALEDKIDKMVYELYGLTEEEIKIVEGGK